MKINYVDGTVERINIDLVETFRIPQDKRYLTFTFTSGRRIECHKSAVSEKTWIDIMAILETWK